MLRNISKRYFRTHISCSSESSQRPSDSFDRPIGSRTKKAQEDVTKHRESLTWASGQHENSWNSKLNLFNHMEQTSDYITMMQQPIELNPRKMFNRWRERAERAMQQFIPERYRILGPDLAAAHFLLFRGGEVKFQHAPDTWLRANEDREFDLPNKYNPAYKVIGLKCDNVNLFYEGLENLRGLQFIQYLSFKNVENFDDWSLDRVSGLQFALLEHLDISHTKCTHRGLRCLYRMPSLKEVVVSEASNTIEFQLTCAMLEEASPNLRIINTKEVK